MNGYYPEETKKLYENLDETADLELEEAIKLAVEKHPCRHCIWGTYICGIKFRCMFPRCIMGYTDAEITPKILN